MALTSIIGKTVFKHIYGKFKVYLYSAVTQGALIAADSSNDGWILADQSTSVAASAIAMEAGAAGATIWACMAAEVATINEGSSVCAASGDVGSALYLSEDGDVSLTAGTTFAQNVGYVTSTGTFILLPSTSLSGTDVSLSGNLSVGGTLGVTGNTAFSGTITSGTTGAPAGDVTFWPTVAGGKVWLDVNGDTNGAWYFGANDIGIMVYFYGDTASYSVHFDPSGDTNGAWYFGADDYGVDVIFYGQTASAAVTWDASTDDLIWTGLAGMVIGTTGTPLVVTEAVPRVSMYFTSASTDGGTSVEPIYVKSTLTGAGAVGGRSRFHTYTNAALGTWVNAIKGYMEFGATGSTSGLASAVCGELLLSAGTTPGTYAPIESELVADSAVTTGAATAFFYCNIGGSNSTGKTTINTNGYLFYLGGGVVDTANGLFDTINADDIDACAALRIKIGATDYFIPLSTSIAFTA